MKKALWQRSWFAPVIIAGVVGAVGWWAQSTVEGAVKRQVGEELSTLLNAEVAALTLWTDIEKAEVEKFALDAVILGSIVDLLRVAGDPDGGTGYPAPVITECRAAMMPAPASGTADLTIALSRSLAMRMANTVLHWERMVASSSAGRWVMAPR